VRPQGLPAIEGFFVGDLAACLELEGPGAFAAFALEELSALFGSRFPQQSEPIAESRWRADPFIGGAYSHAVVGQVGARARLAAPAGTRLFFAGEACSAHAFSTAHGAYETGIAAANAVIAALGPRA
jgi:monoamine oxidase